MKWFFKRVKDSLMFIFTLVFVSTCLLIYLLHDEISDVYDLWTVDASETVEYSSEEFNKFYLEFKELEIKSNLELNNLKPKLYYHLENISGLEERKLFSEYINKLNFIKEVSSGTIAVYEFDIYKYLNEENKNFSDENILSIELKNRLENI